MEYNTQQRKLPLPEYGRSVQHMVDHALTIEDREERQRCARTIVNIMGGMFPALRDSADFNRRLWDHLAIMSDFQLDIDYPVEVVKRESLEVKPDRLSYPQKNIRFRHYGRFIEDLAKTAADMPDGEEKQRLLFLVASHMKRDYLNWNKDSVKIRRFLMIFPCLLTVRYSSRLLISGWQNSVLSSRVKSRWEVHRKRNIN